MDHLNRIELAGTVGNVRAMWGMTVLSVATCHSSTSGNGSMAIETTLFQVVFPGECDLKKGDAVHVVGRVRMRRYMSSDGVERSLCEIVASEQSRAE